MGILRAQGATEYLILLAVVLIVALVSVALLGFFPGMASDAKITQSQSYWRGQAKPFAILDAGLSGTSGNLSLHNREATGQYIITNISIGTTAAVTNLTVGGVATTPSFAAGETKMIGYLGGPACTSGQSYEFNITISYTTSSMGTTVLKQYGAKNLIGKCI